MSPEIATQLPDGVLPEITLPTYHPPGVGTLRKAAESAQHLEQARKEALRTADAVAEARNENERLKAEADRLIGQ